MKLLKKEKLLIAVGLLTLSSCGLSHASNADVSQPDVSSSEIVADSSSSVSSFSSSSEEIVPSSEEAVPSSEEPSSSEESSSSEEESSSFFSDEESVESSSEEDVTESVEIDPGYYWAAEVNNEASYTSVNRALGTPSLGTIGHKSLLVIPVEFEDYPFEEGAMDDIRLAMEGNPGDEGLYWESLRSFYETSSYGMMTMDFEYLDPIEAGTVEKALASYPLNSPIELPSYLLREGVESYKKENGRASTKKFDSDGDGYIDAVIMIYSAPTFQSNWSLGKYGDLFWAWSTYDVGEYGMNSGKPASPVAFRYFWCSTSFFHDYTEEADSHTLIHEMGHLMGAPDYYNTSSRGDHHDEPSGGKMMMANNILDHDIFTKLSFGWVNPYVVTGECTITIGPAEDNGDCIILADNWNGTSFDEFIIIELFTGEGLNYQDSHFVYPEYYGTTNNTGYSKQGVRMFHVDNRLFYGNYFNEQGSLVDSGPLSDDDVINFNSTLKSWSGYIYTGVTNSYYGDCSSIYGKGFEQLQFIQKPGKRTTVSPMTMTGDDDLFYTGDTMDPMTHHEFFPAMKKPGNSFTFNNGGKCPFVISVDEVGDYKATLSFYRTED